MIGVIYNNYNKLKMENEISSIKFQMVDNIKLLHVSSDKYKYYDTLIVDSSFNYVNVKNDIILIVDDINQNIKINENLKCIQYTSTNIKNKIEEKYDILKKCPNVIVNCIPAQKLEINPIETQDSTIFYHGEDKPENMVDEMFELDMNTHYEIKFYDKKTKIVPSLKHKLSWNVTTNENLNGLIQYKIIKEIENGCLPILLKENCPKYFFAYPFVVSLKELNNEKLLINRVKEVSSYISKMRKDEFKMLANSIYNSIYVKTNWKLEFYKLVNIIKDTA